MGLRLSQQNIMEQIEEQERRGLSNKLRKYAFFLGERDPHVVDDMVQQTFLKVLRSAAYRGDGFVAYSQAILRNCLNDFRRKRKMSRRMQVCLENELDIFADEEREPILAPDRINAVIDELDPDKAYVIRAFYLECRSYRQIAREAGISTYTVNCRLNRARGKLREKFLKIFKKEDPDLYARVVSKEK